MATVAMAVEGVLTDGAPQENTLNYEVSDSGRALFGVFRDSSRLLLLSADPNKDRVQAWLARERLTHYADLHCYPATTMLTPALWRVQHVKDLMGVGHRIAFYIDSDPMIVGAALEAGVDALLVARPGATPGQRADDMRYSPWYDLVATIEQQNMIRAARSMEVGE